jgi:hypothetical protein
VTASALARLKAHTSARAIQLMRCNCLQSDRLDMGAAS